MLGVGPRRETLEQVRWDQNDSALERGEPALRTMWVTDWLADGDDGPAKSVALEVHTLASRIDDPGVVYTMSTQVTHLKESKDPHGDKIYECSSSQ